MQIINFRSGQVDENVLQKTAELYCGIWQEAPWEEDFWKVSDVLQDMQTEFSKKSANAFFIEDKESKKVIGFSWGYPVDKAQARDICGSDDLESLFKQEPLIFYIDELGVASACRGRGVGKILSKSLIAWATACGMRCIILRTDERALAARTLYSELGFKELAVVDVQYSNRTYWNLQLTNI